MQVLSFFALAAVAAAQTSTTTVTAAVAAASTTAAAVVAPTGSDGCSTSGGGRISIINPLQGSVATANQSLTITWSSNGADAAFQSSTIGFQIVDATNSANAQLVAELVFPKPVNVADGTATAVIPASVPAGTAYGIRSTYKDTSKWSYCYSPKFTINAVPAPAVVTTTKSSAAAAGVAAVVAAAAVLAL
ncbi:hypothetical protein BCR33DRAFT_722599 [Rhizoclosmatium globosum]|uniref:Yeast cell wall synthesis Kre9/Knh1-like N-terminal domain-containing protein n=1 Tax=Rhizoclosmatium globosum TaxID=329046 RepID=A0A1Y2BKH4_9FUNG|nr:hypothetical protein BCR33DRAFT_722599 [Rhizoclosmatium globosum]|eukprot:ORY35269.1 hypothetical protein BCR33DRAFT_722599 [Rhizoclosmatium globosum]